MASMQEILAMSQRARVRRCRVAEALKAYEDEGRDEDKRVIEDALANPEATDDAIRKMIQQDGIKAFAEAQGPQSVSFHRAERCICFDAEQN